ncbi:hypothetical protein Lfu02_49810 [Longispora fulva]|uniref:Uncharacterized protein n=1 Tax=Longispora fulva TaxID=619741 RepID=A0A8J7KRB2_9ACTN|nr:hypothetical protein [Longispora fulva]MBG6138357.1 hypothetical protein [Longispora fulva]GIG60609.1 hypothetical protein Lfu02_49810 [Longispora fulva]
MVFGGPAVDTALWEITTGVREYLRHGRAPTDPAARAWVDAHAHQLAGLRGAAPHRPPPAYPPPANCQCTLAAVDDALTAVHAAYSTKTLRASP